ncbi:MAG: hypothetical protein SO144_04665, partial [Campylobacter sp.]|nr:hypothetical protein [Campylobacter sp.]
IGVRLVNKTGTTPAHIVFSKETAANSAGVCKQVADSDPLKAYFDSKVNYTNEKKQSASISNAVAIGSSTSIYEKK